MSHYRAVLGAARAAGIVPWVCLHHFTLPRWFAGTGGFLVERNRIEHWRRHVDFVADTFGDLVGGWQPVNEMNVYPYLAYRGAGFAPGHDDRAEWALASEAIHLATFEAAQRLRRTGATVSSIFASRHSWRRTRSRRRTRDSRRCAVRSGSRESACFATACCAFPAARP